MTPKLTSAQCKTEHQGYHWKELVLTLRPIDPDIATLRETPDRGTWGNIQSDINTALKRGDVLTIVSADGSTIAEKMPVVSAEGGEVYLGKPLRMIQLNEPSAGLYADAQDKVVANGSGYSIHNIRSNRTDDKIFPTADAAKNEILRRKPTKVQATRVA